MRQPIEVSYRWDESECVAAFSAHVAMERERHRGASRRSQWRATIFLALMLLGASSLAARTGSLLHVAFAILLLGLAIAVGFLWSLFGWINRSMIRRQCRDMSPIEMNYEVSERGIMPRGADASETGQPWDAVTRVVERDGGVLVYQDEKTFLWLPAHAFQGDGLDRFRALAAENVPAAREPESYPSRSR